MQKSPGDGVAPQYPIESVDNALRLLLLLGERTEEVRLTDVSADSGGIHQLIVTRQGIESALIRMASAIGARYEITYSRPDSLVPPDSLKVEVKRPKTRVWAPVWTGK